MSVSAPADTQRRTEPWLALDDPPTLRPTPLSLALHQTVMHGRAATLNRALGLTDPERLAGRLVGVHQGRAALHAEHLDALTAPLPPALRRAYHQAMGVAAPQGWPTERVAGHPRLNLLRLPTLRRQANRPAGPLPDSGRAAAATALTVELETLRDDPSAVSTFNAALCSDLLRQMTQHWLDDRAALHLELLTSLRDDRHPAVQTAMQHVRTTLSGTRRQVALALIREARQQHRNLSRHREAQDAYWRAAVRAAVRCARQLTDQGALNRVADAHWLTPFELRDALDGTLERRALSRLVNLRRAEASLSALPGFSRQPSGQVLSGLALSPGVRDGRLHRLVPGLRPPSGAVVLCPHPALGTFRFLGDTGALVVIGAGELSRVAAHAREHTLSALGLAASTSLPGWCEDGALVRLNAHQGTLTLLRRAGEPLPLVAPEPFDLDLNDLLNDPALPHVRVQRRAEAFTLDFEPA